MNMKQLIYMVMLGIAACGCSRSESVMENPVDAFPPVPLEISSAFLPEGTLTVTRAASAPLTNGSVGLFLQGKEAVTGYIPINNCEYAYSSVSGTWEPSSSGSTIYLGGETANICAYFPYCASGYDDKTGIVLTMQEYDADKEIFYAPDQEKNATPSGRKLTLSLTHAYSQIQLDITREDYPTQCSISGIALKNDKLLTSGTINITDGTVTGTDGDYVLASLPYILAQGSTYTRNLLVLPSALTADAMDNTKGLTIELTVDTRLMTVKIPLSELTNLEKGKKHVISLKIKGTAIETAVSTTGWDEKILNGGTDYVPEPQP